MTTASAGALPAPPERPGWWPVVVAVFLGYVCAAFALFGLKLLAVLLGLVAWNEPKVSDAILRGPYAVDGAWSLAANAAVAFTVVAVGAWVVARVLERRLEEPVSLPLVFAALAVSGYVPFLALEGRFRLSGLLGLLVAAGLIRWLAVGDARAALAVERARARLLERGWWRRLVVAGAIAWAAALSVAVAYGLAHPLTGGYAIDYEPSNYVYQRIGDQQYHVFRGPPGTEGSYTFDFRNAGFAGLTVESVEVPEGYGFALAGFSLASSPGDSGRERGRRSRVRVARPPAPPRPLRGRRPHSAARGACPLHGARPGREPASPADSGARGSLRLVGSKGQCPET